MVFGAAIAEAASDAGLPLQLRRLGIPDQWIPCGSQSDQKDGGIDATSHHGTASRTSPGKFHCDLNWSQIKHPIDQRN